MSKNEQNTASIQCMECEHLFRKTIRKRTQEIKCPKCGSTDVEVVG